MLLQLQPSQEATLISTHRTHYTSKLADVLMTLPLAKLDEFLAAIGVCLVCLTPVLGDQPMATENEEVIHLADDCSIEDQLSRVTVDLI